jgi:hypothetical protein
MSSVVPVMDSLIYAEHSQDSSVGRAKGWTAVVRFPAGARDFSLLPSIQTGCGTHLASYPTGIGGSFPESKADGALS